MSDIKIIETKTVDLDEIRREIVELQSIADSIELLPVEELPLYAADLVATENTERELIKADILEKIKLLEEELIKYG